MTHTSLLSDLIDLLAACRADRATGYSKQKQRDREIGQALQASRDKPVAQIRGWLSRVDIPGLERSGQHGAQLYHVLGLILVVAGLATGWGFARAVLYYDGEQPVNIVNALALLVLLQLLLLMLWLLASLPIRIPLFSSLQSALRLLNPGRLTKHLARLFPASFRTSLSAIWDDAHGEALRPVSRWLFSFWSQLFAVSFNIGALAAAFYLISFSDMAFAWSTTLDLGSGGFHRLLSNFSFPWQAVSPEAVPSLNLVENSRYFRLDQGSLATNGDPSRTPALLAQWWPFLIAAIVFYALLPRLATLLISWLRLRHHLRQALLRLPGSPELQARMNSPLISTAALDPENTATLEQSLEFTTSPLLDGLRSAIVCWSDASPTRAKLDYQLRSVGIEPLAYHVAGGARTTDEDREIVATLCASKPQGVAVVVKAWEPPLLEFVDFVRALREQCAGEIPIVVALHGDEETVTDQDLETWQLILRQLQDRRLQLVPLPVATTP